MRRIHPPSAQAIRSSSTCIAHTAGCSKQAIPSAAGRCTYIRNCCHHSCQQLCRTIPCIQLAAAELNSKSQISSTAGGQTHQQHTATYKLVLVNTYTYIKQLFCKQPAEYSIDHNSKGAEPAAAETSKVLSSSHSHTAKGATCSSKLQHTRSRSFQSPPAPALPCKTQHLFCQQPASSSVSRYFSWSHSKEAAVARK